VANKSTGTSLGTSDTLYPSQNAVKTYVDTAIAGLGGGAESWASITGTPTSLAGYGITDALSAATAAATYQPIGSYLTAISGSEIDAALGFTPQAALSGTGFVKISGTTISYDNSTYLTTASAAASYQPIGSYLTGITSAEISLALGYTPQAALSGTGFVKISGTTISYDNSTYLTTAAAAGTYAPLASPAFTGTPSFTLGSDATGDIYYRNSSGVLARLGIGTSGQVLTVAGGLPGWANAGAGVTSTSNSDGTLTISPTSGAVVASLNLANANTWTGVQTVHVNGPQIYFGDGTHTDSYVQTYSGGLLINPGGTGNATFQGGLTINTALNVGGGGVALGAQSATTSVNGSTSGTVKFYQIFGGACYKSVIIYCNSLVGTASFTFGNAFANTPAIVTTNGLAASVVTSLSTGSVTITGATTTGYIELIGT